MSEFDISALTDYTSSLLSNAQDTAATANINKAVKAVDKASTDDELLSACKQFEAYLWEQVYKNVDKTTNLFGSQSEGSYAGNMVNMFSDTLIQKVSEMSVTNGDNSLAMRLYEQMKRNYGIGDVKETETDDTAE